MFLTNIFFFGVALICGVNGIAVDEFKVVETMNGKIRGKQSETLLKKMPYFSFKGIPYAKPPIGGLRFEAPQPIDSWKPTVLDAFEHGHICPQPGRLLPLPFSQSEDCLTLNIFMPSDIVANEKLAVLFFIHGGGFTEGSSDDLLYGPDFLIEKRTILVTLNYRLGIFGFLSLNATDYAGNMGLKDQQLALKWIHANIDRFGGDNKRITIFGQSAGGASAHYHMFSAESRKYFRNAFPMSGTIHNYFALSEENNQLKRAFEIAKDLGEPKTSVEQLIAFLKNAPLKELVNYSICRPSNGLLFCEFLPVIERRDAKRPFIVETIDEIYKKSNVDVDAWFSFTSNEFLGFMLFEGAPSVEDLSKPLNASLSLPFRGLSSLRDTKNYKNHISEVRKFYFGDGTANEHTFSQNMALLSDMNLVYAIDKSAKLHATKSHAKTFYHRFSVESKLNLKRLGAQVADQSGSGHADEICYIFRCNLLQSAYDEIILNNNDEQSKISLQTIDYITDLVANFAKFGEPAHQKHPIDEFPPIQNEKLNFLDIRNDGLKIGQQPNAKANEFWARIDTFYWAQIN